MVEKMGGRNQVDKGWAWTIMLATFGCHVIIGGLQHTGGLVRYALQENIQKENLHYVTWLGSVYSGLISLSGPLSSLMVYKLGCRLTVLLGATLETIGFLTSYFIQNEKLFFLTYSLLAGSGSGITYSAVMIAVGYNFDKYLALASGISVSGQGFGLLLVSQILNYSYEYYGFKGSFLVMASLTLQKWIFGSLLQPSVVEMAQTNRFWLKDPYFSSQDGNMELEISKETTSVMIKKALSALSLNSHQSSRPEYDLVAVSQLRIHTDHDSTLSLGTNKDFKKSHEFSKEEEETTFSIPNFNPTESKNGIFQNFKFLNFLFCVMCSSTAEGMVYLLVPGYFINSGASQTEASRILSLIGVCSTITRPLMGFLANSEIADIYTLFIGPYGILGIFTFFLPFYVYSLAGRIIFAICFGLYNCSVYAILNKLTLRIAGMENMATAFGIEMLIWGITGILGTPLADSIIRWTGSFNSAFYFAGCMYLICTIAGLFLLLDFSKKPTQDPQPVPV